MRRTTVLIASAAINASTMPAVAAEYTSNKGIDVSRALVIENARLSGHVLG